MDLIHHRNLFVAATLGLAALTTPLAQANTSVLAPTATVSGIDQATLSQQWWNWAASYPTIANPLNDLTGSLSSLGDQGSYFFLAGANTTDPVVRSVTVRNDQTLFFPLINVVDGYTDQQIIDQGLTESGIRTETTNFMGNASGLSLKLDGADLPLPAGSASLLAFRQPTGRFDLILPTDDNIFGGPAAGSPAGTYRAFSDGYWVALSPLATGAYELHLGGNKDGTGPFDGIAFSQDITYRISAVPEPATLMFLLAGLAVVSGVAARRRRA